MKSPKGYQRWPTPICYAGRNSVSEGVFSIVCFAAIRPAGFLAIRRFELLITEAPAFPEATVSA